MMIENEKNHVIHKDLFEFRKVSDLYIDVINHVIENCLNEAREVFFQQKVSLNNQQLGINLKSFDSSTIEIIKLELESLGFYDVSISNLIIRLKWNIPDTVNFASK